MRSLKVTVLQERPIVFNDGGRLEVVMTIPAKSMREVQQVSSLVRLQGFHARIRTDGGLTLDLEPLVK